jgi:hypothetical protein
MKFFTAAFFAGAILSSANTGVAAQSSPASPATAPSPSPSGLTNPCGSILSIVTRPTVTTSVCPVRAGHVLLESGYAATTVTGTGGGVTAAYPATLLHIGLSQNADLEVTPPSYDRSSIGDVKERGLSDTGIGAKWELGYTGNAVWGASAQVTAPTGTPAFSAGRSQYTANANWGYTINSEFSLSGTFSFNSLAGTSANGQILSYAAFIPSVYLAAALPNSAQVYGEYAHFSHDGPGLPAKDVFDFAYQRDFGPNVQFDVEYGFQPTTINGQRLHYVGFGFSLMR